MSPTKQITKLTDKERQTLFDHIRSLDRAWLNTCPVDYEAVEAALLRLAAVAGMPVPQVVWAESPRQMIMLMLLYDVLTSETDEAQRRELRQKFGTAEVREVLCLDIDQAGLPEWSTAYTSLLQQFNEGGAKPLDIGIVDTYNDHRPLTDRVRSLNRKVQATFHPELVKTIEKIEIVAARESLENQHSTHFAATALINQVLGIAAPGVLAALISSWVQTGSRINFNPQPDIWSETVTPIVGKLKSFAILLKSIRRDRLDLTQMSSVLQPINWHYFKLWQITAPLSVLDQRIYNFSETQLASDWHLAVHAAFSYQFGDGITFACKKPVFVSTDERLRLHNNEDPCIEFLDGYKLYAWHGIAIPEKIWVNFDQLTPDDITSESNLERRRALIDKFGPSRYLAEAGAELISSDECGDLFRMELHGDEPLVMVRVTNSTPEPDGSSKHYFLRVPPRVKSAKEGIAWTFGLEENEYAPQNQT